jgi:predicted HTH transcriptional regulator
VAINTISLEQITEQHLNTLIENRVPESRDLEFKRDQIGRDDAAKKEFLKDVSALANTAGGDLIIGMGEVDGVAASLHGIMAVPADDEMRRLEAILQDGLEPRLIGTRIQAVLLTGGGYVLVIRIQASWNAPHRVIYQRSNRFYGRNAAGTYEFGVEQLRAAFLVAPETERRLTDFRVYPGSKGVLT